MEDDRESSTDARAYENGGDDTGGDTGQVPRRAGDVGW